MPGAKLEGSRVKEPESQANKDDRGKPAETNIDNLGARISVETPEAARQVKENIEQQLPVTHRDKIDSNGLAVQQYGVQTGAPGEANQVSEIQVVPKAQAEAMKETTPLYEQQKAAIASGDQAEADRLGAEITRLHTAAAPEPVYKHGNTQANIPDGSPAAGALDRFRSSIPDEHLAGDGKDVGAGGNHVTVRYGIKGDDIEGIRKFIESQAPFTAHLGQTDVFPPSEHSDGAAVVNAKIEAPELARLNDEIQQHGDFAPSSFEDYKPHATIAYIDPKLAEQYKGRTDLQGAAFPVNSITISDRHGNQVDVPLKGTQAPSDRRVDQGTRKRIDEMTPEEMRTALKTSDKTGLPNRRAFDEAQQRQSASTVGMSDADGLKALNDRFGYQAGDELLRAKADALRQAGVEAYHDKGDEFLYRAKPGEDLPAKLEQARAALRDREFEVTMKDGTTHRFKGADFSYGSGQDISAAEAGLKQHKASREARGERARGELRGITETGSAAGGQREGGAAEVTPQPGSVPAKGSTGSMLTADIHADPQRFQYKMNVNKEGVTGLLKGQKWNPDLGLMYPIGVWQDPADGKTYVVEGHHRLDLAKENGIETMNVAHIPAKTAEEARSTAAIGNIAQGRGTPVDAAKFFRDSRLTVADLKARGISLGEATAANGLALSRLDQSLFDKVVNGTLRLGRAIAIGNATGKPEEQESILKLIQRQEMKGRKVSDDTVDELARMVGGAGEHTETQTSLFGVVEMRRNLALEKAEISSYIREQIGQEKRLFSTVANQGRAERLEKGKNKIDAADNAKIAQEAAEASEVYDRLSTRAGAVDDILNQAAKELAEGKDNAATIKRAAYERARAAISEALPGSQAAGAGRPQTNVAGPAEKAPARPVTNLAAGGGTAATAAAAAGGITEGSPVTFKDGRAGVVAYVAPPVNGVPARLRVRLTDGQVVRSVRPQDVNKVTVKPPDPDSHWVGVDLDGTLAHYDGFKGSETIGAPIPAMLDRIKGLLADGKDVRIFTARIADDPQGKARAAIEAWSQQHVGQALPVTNVKDDHMTQMYDDRAVQVERNTGKIMGGAQAEEAASAPAGGQGNAIRTSERGNTVQAGGENRPGVGGGSEAAGPVPVQRVGLREREAGPLPTNVPEQLGSAAGREPADLRGNQAGAVRGGEESGGVVPRQPTVPAGRTTAPSDVLPAGPAGPEAARGPGAGGTDDVFRQPGGRQVGETAAAFQERLLARGRYQKELGAAESRQSWENAAKATLQPTRMHGAPVQVMNPDAYEALRKIVFPEDRFPGVFLGPRAATQVVSRMRSFESNLRQRPGMRTHADALRTLTLKLDGAQEQDGSLLLLRGDHSEDPSTLLEELAHRWQQRTGLRDSDVQEQVAHRPEFAPTMQMLKLNGYNLSSSDLAAELIAKALAGDSTVTWTHAVQNGIVDAALRAAVDEKGPSVLDEMPPVSPAVAETVKKVREYAEGIAKGTGEKGGGLAEENGPGLRKNTGSERNAPRQRAGPGSSVGRTEQGDTAAGAPETELGKFKRLTAQRRLPGEQPLPGFGEAVKAQDEAAQAQQALDLTRRMLEPRPNIDRATGRMERESPLFAGTAANPQASLFGPDPAGTVTNLFGEPDTPQGSLFKREQVQNVPPWYLKSDKLINDKMRGPMPGDALLRMLENNGVKPDELKWSGLDELRRPRPCDAGRGAPARGRECYSGAGGDEGRSGSCKNRNRCASEVRRPCPARGRKLPGDGPISPGANCLRARQPWAYP